MLAPFIEGFLVSLKPLSLLFSSPYSFWHESASLDAYYSMWVSVPAFGSLQGSSSVNAVDLPPAASIL